MICIIYEQNVANLTIRTPPPGHRVGFPRVMEQPCSNILGRRRTPPSGGRRGVAAARLRSRGWRGWPALRPGRRPRSAGGGQSSSFDSSRAHGMQPGSRPGTPGVQRRPHPQANELAWVNQVNLANQCNLGHSSGDQVILFWPIKILSGDGRASFPIRLATTERRQVGYHP
jgi:hypothetical protein